MKDSTPEASVHATTTGSALVSIVGLLNPTAWSIGVCAFVFYWRTEIREKKEAS